MNPIDSRDYKGRFQNFNTIYKDIGTHTNTKIIYAEMAFPLG